MKTVSSITVVFIAIVSICALTGCQESTGASRLKTSIREGIVIGHEVEKMERAKGNDSTADKIKIIVSQVEKVIDTNDIGGNCTMLQATTDMAYEWVSENYPQTPYPLVVALLKERLNLYCDGE